MATRKYYLIENPNSCATSTGFPGFWGYTSRRSSIRLIVIHTAEIAADEVGEDLTAERISRYAATVCDRKVSWHASTDSDSIVWMIPDEYTGFHASNYNSSALGIEQGIYAHQWPTISKAHRDAMIDNIATVTAEWCKKHNIPPRRIQRADADAGGKGIIAHADLDPGRRTDPGAAFPWSQFLESVVRKIDGPEEPIVKPGDRKKMVYIYAKTPNGGQTGQFLTDGMTKRLIKGEAEKVSLQKSVGIPNVAPRRVGWDFFKNIPTVKP